MVSPSAPMKDYGAIYSVGPDVAWGLQETSTYLVPLLDKMVWGPGEAMMDHGCGTGSVTLKYLAPRAKTWGSKIYGVDISESMLDVARANNAHPNVEYLLGDLPSLNLNFPLNHGSMDKVFSIWAFRNVYHKVETVEKWFELLKPGGELLMLNTVDTVYTKLNRDLRQDPRWSALLREGLAEGHWYPGPPSSAATCEERGTYHLAEYVRLLSRTGFEVHDNFVTTSDETYDYATCAENVIACNPQPFAQCVRSRADQLALEAAIFASFEKHCDSRVLENGAVKQFQDTSVSVCIRAEKPRSDRG